MGDLDVYANRLATLYKGDVTALLESVWVAYTLTMHTLGWGAYMYPKRSEWSKDTFFF